MKTKILADYQIFISLPLIIILSFKEVRLSALIILFKEIKLSVYCNTFFWINKTFTFFSVNNTFILVIVLLFFEPFFRFPEDFTLFSYHVALFRLLDLTNEICEGKPLGNHLS